MDDITLQSAVLRIVLTELAKRGEMFVPVSSSGRHVHLSQADVNRLFGAGTQLTKLRDLQQPGQFAANERVTLETGKGSLTLRVVGPARRETQVELSVTDCVKLGVKPVVRMSGDTLGTPGCALINGDRRVEIDHGVIVAARHLHMSPEEASGFGLKDGDVVALQAEGPRAAILENVVVRSGSAHSLEAHIDTDELNACGLADGQLCRILTAPRETAPETKPMPHASANSPALTGSSANAMRIGATPSAEPTLKTYVPKTAPGGNPPGVPNTVLDLTGEKRRLLTEEDVIRAARDGVKCIRCARDAVITPLALDAASAKGVELSRMDS